MNLTHQFALSILLLLLQIAGCASGREASIDETRSPIGRETESAAASILVQLDKWTTCEGILAVGKAGNSESADLTCDDGDLGTIKIQGAPGMYPASGYFILRSG